MPYFTVYSMSIDFSNATPCIKSAKQQMKSIILYTLILIFIHMLPAKSHMNPFSRCYHGCYLVVIHFMHGLFTLFQGQEYIHLFLFPPSLLPLSASLSLSSPLSLSLLSPPLSHFPLSPPSLSSLSPSPPLSGTRVSTKAVMIHWLQSILPEWKISNLNTDWNDGRSAPSNSLSLPLVPQC